MRFQVRHVPLVLLWPPPTLSVVMPFLPVLLLLWIQCHLLIPPSTLRLSGMQRCQMGSTSSLPVTIPRTLRMRMKTWLLTTPWLVAMKR